jgi:alcohol dehydrogenase class IV
MDVAQYNDLLSRSPVRVIFGHNRVDDIGTAAKSEGAQKVLLVTDPGIVQAGHVRRVVRSLESANIAVTVFDGVQENPTTEHVAKAVAAGRSATVDFIIGVGGGSAMDAAKGANLILSNGGQIADYWGVNKPTEPMLPMIAVPTTAGTGSEAQSFALISDPETHQKMACGDRRLPTDGGLRPRVAILDPSLTQSVPPRVVSTAGIDALAHAVETSATRSRNDLSRAFSTAAWTQLNDAFQASLTNPLDEQARASMLLGAHLAGAAIEQSMLGAAHACANPLTARFNIPHGQAVGLMLPHVIRFNCEHGLNHYADLTDDPQQLAARIESCLIVARLARRLRDLNVPPDSFESLAETAASQWTAEHNPIDVTAKDLAELFQSAH